MMWLAGVLFIVNGYAQKPENERSKQDSTAKQDSVILEEIKDNLLDNIPTITLGDDDFADASSQNVSSLLTAGRDPFFSAASFNFSAARFRIRGYDGDYFATYMNGIPMDNLDNGFTPYGLWGGLNDVLRNRDVAQNLRYSTYAFGDIGSTTNIDSRASKQRRQTSFSYAAANRNYNQRWSFTHSSGISKKGWAFTISGSRRWANEGYVPGTYYNGWSYFAGIDKRIGQKQLLSLVVFGAPTENGRQGAAVAEIQNLTGSHYYNPLWGYQNGKKRNASVGKSNQPVFILTHDFRISNHSTLVTAIGYSFGDRSTSALDWYNAPDPRPDFYRYLPSYQLDEKQKQQVTDAFIHDPSVSQINWQHLYDVNRDSYATINNANGTAGNTVSGHRSLYVLQDRVVNTRRINFNTVYNTKLSLHADLTAGVSYQSQVNHYYQRVNDLLGGEFFVDLNQFAQRDFPTSNDAAQNDLNRPNRILKVGDEYGYNYNIHINKTAGWAQTVLKFNRFDFFAAGELSRTGFWRVGNVRNGLFPNNSFGKSSVNNFTNYSVKGGITYKLNGRNYFYANAAYLTRAPYFDNAYISARTRDFLQDSLTSEKITTLEAGYILNAPKLKIHLSGYYTRFQNGLNVLTFYHDDYRNFVNYALRDIGKVHFGAEFGIEARLTNSLTLNAAASVGRYYYNTRQQATVTVDNSQEVIANETVYSKNFRVPATPQEAYSIGFTYRSPKFWFLSVNGNYFRKMWLDFNPIRRTYTAVEGLDNQSKLFRDIIDQQSLEPQYTVDLFGGYSWKLPKTQINKKNVFLVFNLGINNLLNNQNLVTGGYEQLRFDFKGNDINKFPPKYFYGYGASYFASVTFRF